LPPDPRTHRGGRGPLIGIVFGILVILGVGFGVATTVFDHATATVTVRTFTVPVSGSFEASPTGANLAFATKTATKTLSKTVPSTGSEHVSDSASGTIIVSNAYSATSQHYVANTRFQRADGHIYKTKVPVTVPGYTMQGVTIVPGTVEVMVYASEPGDASNTLAIVDFTIPGLKGAPQFTKVTARSKAALTGGFVGDRAVVSDAVRTKAVTDLSNELGAAARAALMAGLKSDDLIVPTSVTVSFATDPDQPVSGGATVTVHATASAPVFSIAVLARVIASGGTVTVTGPFTITNLSSLAPTVTPSKTAGNLTLMLTGTAFLKGTYDRTALIQSLAGKNRKDAGAALSAYPAIEDMKIAVYPFWATTLPTDPGKITIKETLNAAP
jgi:hypothetical protein